MYLHKEFLSARFAGRNKYHFSDKVLVDFRELQTVLNVELSGDETLKVVMQESYGLNGEIALR